MLLLAATLFWASGYGGYGGPGAPGELCTYLPVEGAEAFIRVPPSPCVVIASSEAPPPVPWSLLKMSDLDSSDVDRMAGVAITDGEGGVRVVRVDIGAPTPDEEAQIRGGGEESGDDDVEAQGEDQDPAQDEDEVEAPDEDEDDVEEVDGVARRKRYSFKYKWEVPHKLENRFAGNISATSRHTGVESLSS